jgi:hypothetical protein
MGLRRNHPPSVLQTVRRFLKCGDNFVNSVRPATGVNNALGVNSVTSNELSGACEEACPALAHPLGRRRRASPKLQVRCLPGRRKIRSLAPSLPSGSGGGTQRVLSYLQHWLGADGLCARGALCVAWPGYITCDRYSSSDESSTSVSSGSCAVCTRPRGGARHIFTHNERGTTSSSGDR